jgi:hypothetical protein
MGSVDYIAFQKLLANNPSRVNPINSFPIVVPKKTKTVAKESEAVAQPADMAAPVGEKRARRAPSKTRKTAAKKTPKSPTAGTTSPKSSGGREPTDEQIRLRAYFISERRHRLRLPGDASSDWLEAKRQLLSESGQH